MTDIEIGLRAVLGDEDLAVLERVHRARVDVEVRVELLHRDAKATRGKKLPEAGGREALAKRGGDAPGDEYVLGCPRLKSHGLPPYRTWRASLAYPHSSTQMVSTTDRKK
ncbi:hypothetical protein GCM10027521_63760 [Amycolatopsis cihanbeyliensis]